MKVIKRICIYLMTIVFIMQLPCAYSFATQHRVGDKPLVMKIDDNYYDVYTKGSYTSIKAVYGEEYWNVFGPMFQEDSTQLIAFSKKGDSYWVLSIKEAKGAPNLSQVSDAEIIETFGSANQTTSEGTMKVLSATTMTINDAKYVVTEYELNKGERTTIGRMYMTIVDEQYYIFNLNPITEKTLTKIETAAFESNLKTAKYGEEDDKGTARQENAKEQTGTIYYIGIIVVAIIGLVAYLSKNNKSKQKDVSESEASATKKDQDAIEKDDGNEIASDAFNQDLNDIPMEALLTLKDLYDNGILTEEEYKKKKKQLLGL